ncbi:MAG: nicotinate-nucleotide--dimethylbenzimidazole phosphoribosyltransferase [Oscillospiraceae bacterium]|nr:nicotinate-nucleotide--dimethylbenzimidazole phosphoribosyltransferase [Oscillospiraceae bacterium]
MEYTERALKEVIAGVQPADREVMAKAEKRQAELAKPPGSLGKLESISIQMAGITGSLNNRIEKKRVLVFAADNGVWEEGVASSPQSVTMAQTVNLTKGLTGCGTLCGHFGVDLQVWDMGVKLPYRCEAVINRSIAKGTKNLYREPAMTRAQAVQALMTGVEAAERSCQEGMHILGIGEMGICNTTTSSAVLAALLGTDAAAVTGRGGGLTDAAFEKKKRVIDEALALHRLDRNDPVDVLSKVGGFDLSAMAGAFIGCARYRIPVVVDGFISIVAALVAVRLCPAVRDYLIPSHESFEKGYALACRELGFEAYLNLGMRLGEGSGCPIAFEIVSAACAILDHMATFAEAEINDDYLEDIRGKDSFTVNS